MSGMARGKAHAKARAKMAQKNEKEHSNYGMAQRNSRVTTFPNRVEKQHAPQGLAPKILPGRKWDVISGHFPHPEQVNDAPPVCKLIEPP